MPGIHKNAVAGASILLDRGVIDRIRLAWRLMRDDRVSPLKFVIPALLALYVGSPDDAVPDLFLGIGQVDDVGIVVMAVLLLIRLVPTIAPQHVVEEHLRAMSGEGRGPEATPAPATEPIDVRFNVRS